MSNAAATKAELSSLLKSIQGSLSAFRAELGALNAYNSGRVKHITLAKS